MSIRLCRPGRGFLKAGLLLSFAAIPAAMAAADASAQTSKPQAKGQGEPLTATTVEQLLPTEKSPILIPKEDTETHQKWAKLIDAYMNIPADKVTAHPAAADFPGAVPDDAPRVSRDVSVDLSLPRWHSTGLYAAPGKPVTIRVSKEDAARGLSIVVGGHTDKFTDQAKWSRFPRLSRRFAITQTETTVANAFGGLIYIDVPRDEKLGGHKLATYGGYGWLDESPDPSAAKAIVHISGAVAAPLYVLGQTTPDQWKQMLQSKAPWGELQSDKIVLTVQTGALSSVADPAALLQFWGKVIDTEAQLAGWPRQPASQERITLDRQISAGWMHSGYPVMAHLKSQDELLNLPKLQKDGSWGYFHELGHNHEGQAYTFGPDYVEVDVNLYSMYVMDKLIGREMTAHAALANMPKLMTERLGTMKRTDAWANLAMYVKTIQAFGWEPLHQTLASYAVPGGADGIKSREQKMDQWVLRYSKATGKNLIEYYKLFDVTCSDQTAAALKDLPSWMPDDLAKYQTK